VHILTTDFVRAGMSSPVSVLTLSHEVDDVSVFKLPRPKRPDSPASSTLITSRLRWVSLALLSLLMFSLAQPSSPLQRSRHPPQSATEHVTSSKLGAACEWSTLEQMDVGRRSHCMMMISTAYYN